MITTYRYTEDGSIQRHDKTDLREVSHLPYIENSEKFKELIDSGVDIESYDKDGSIAKAKAIQESVDKRDAALNALEFQCENGIIQTRPQDLSNIKLGIVQGQTRWKAKDNTVIQVTTAELQQAEATGIANGQAIWDDHLDEIEAL